VTTACVPRRIRVVGVSGSGKTRLARALAGRLGLAHLELDAVFWDADWRFRDLGQARALLDDFVAAHPGGWVVDGNWTSRLEGRLEPPDGVDLVVWLDHSRPLVMWRVVTRTLRRGLTRQELWHGNRERPASWLSRDPEQNIMLWSWTTHATTRARLAPRVGTPGFLRLAGRRQVAAWLRSLPDERSQAAVGLVGAGRGEDLPVGGRASLRRAASRRRPWRCRRRARC
jgi:adenylate kinase family enzyme